MGRRKQARRQMTRDELVERLSMPITQRQAFDRGLEEDFELECEAEEGDEENPAVELCEGMGV